METINETKVKEVEGKEKFYLVSKEKVITVDKNDEIVVNGKKIESALGVAGLAVSKESEARRLSREFYQRILSSQSENLIVLTGAGSSVGIGNKDTGKTMSELWDLAKQDPEIGLEKLCAQIKFTEGQDIEKLLSRANRAKEFLNDGIDKQIKKIEALIQEKCTLQLPDNSPHEILLNRIVKRKLKYPRTKIFTLNYDTLFEQAAEIAGFTVMDGFSFATRRTFRGAHFDYDVVLREKSRIKNEENFIPKVFHLYKLHGSINWEADGKKNYSE